jgi:hypothetical protein
MALRLCDVQCDPIADRALRELTHRYTVAEEKSRLVLTEKAGNMKLFLNDLDDLHQWDFIHNQEMMKEHEQLRQQRESWKVRALVAEAELLKATAKTSNNGGCQNVSDLSMLRSSAIWQSSSTLIAPPDKASRRLSETRSSSKSGARLTASIKESRPPAPRRGNHLRRLDRPSLGRGLRRLCSVTPHK